MCGTWWRPHVNGPFELIAEGYGVAIKARDKEQAAWQPEMAVKCLDILNYHQEEVAEWLWSLIR